MQWILESLRNKYLRIHEYVHKHIPIYISKYTNSYIHKHTYMPHIQALVVWNPIFSSKYFLIYISSQQIENILPNLFNFTTKKHICKCRQWLNRLQDHKCGIVIYFHIHSIFVSYRSPDMSLWCRIYNNGRIVWDLMTGVFHVFPSIMIEWGSVWSVEFVCWSLPYYNKIMRSIPIPCLERMYVCIPCEYIFEEFRYVFIYNFMITL